MSDVSALLASSASGERISLRDLAVCRLCSKSFKEPKLLPCLHTYCLGCLEQWTKNLSTIGGGGPLTCPACAHPFNGGAGGGLSELHANPLAARLAKLRLLARGGRDDEDEGGASVCSACSEGGAKEGEGGGEVKAAEMFCVDCCEKLCDGCAKVHLQFRLTKGHKVISLADMERGHVSGLSPADQPIYCEHHNTELVAFFCTTCTLAVCAKCLLTNHKAHDYVPVEEAAAEGRQRLEADLAVLAEGVGRHEAVIRSGGAERDELVKRLKETEAEIRRKADELKQLVDGYRLGMTEAVEGVQTRKLAELEQHVTSARRHIATLDAFKQFVAALKDKGTHPEVATLSALLKERARVLSAVYPRDVDFLSEVSVEDRRPGVGANANRMENILGKLVILDRTGELGESEDASELYLAPPKALGTVPGEKFVHGVAVVEDLLYVVRDKGTQVEVYHVETLAQRPNIRVRGLQDPVGLAASGRHRLLYIASAQDKSVYVVSADGSGTVKTWSLDHKPKGISVSRDGHVIVTFQEERLLQELSPDGAVLKEIRLPDDMKSPWHAVAVPGGGGVYLVCHGNVDDAMHRLCEVHSDGRLGRVYDGRSAGSTSPSPSPLEVTMKMPTQIAIDSHGCVILADYFTSCVRLLSPQLSFKRYLLTKADQGLGGPTSMWLDTERGVLCVGQFDGKVHVFRLIKDLIVKLDLNLWD